MAKPVTAIVKLQVPAGQATPAPPVGTALGPHGVNIMDFVKQFNAKTASQAGMVTPVVVTIYKDRTFTFITKTPPAAVLLKKEAGIEKGSPTSNREKVGKVTRAQLKKIAEIKMQDLNATDRDGALHGPDGGGLMRTHGKQYRAAAATLEAKKLYPPPAAVEQVKSTAFAKFDESVDVAVRLGVDPKHADQIVCRVDKSSIGHARIGKKSFAATQLADNLQAFMDAIVKAKPSAAKGHYIRSVTVSSTMGPGVRVDPAGYHV